MVAMVRIGGFLHAGRTVHDLRQFGRARPDPVLLDSAHEPIWLCLVLRPIGHHTAAHALLLAPRARAATREGFASCWRAEGMKTRQVIPYFRVGPGRHSNGHSVCKLHYTYSCNFNLLHVITQHGRSVCKLHVINQY